MLKLLTILFAFYTQYKYSSDFVLLLEDPVNMALGGDHTVSMWSVSSPYWNPAGISEKTIGISHFSYYENFIGLENAGVSGIKSGNYMLSLFVSYLHSKPVELTELVDTALGATEGNIKVVSKERLLSFSIYGGVKRDVNHKLSVGITFHYSLQNLPDYNLNDAGIDGGLVYTLSSKIILGGKISNIIASRFENGNREILRPFMNITMLTHNDKLKYYFTASLEYDGEKDYSFFTYHDMSIHASMGMEYWLSHKIAIRAGTGRYGMALGAGLNLHRLHVDYAIRPFNNAGITHKLALSYRIE